MPCVCVKPVATIHQESSVEHHTCHVMMQALSAEHPKRLLCLNLVGTPALHACAWPLMFRIPMTGFDLGGTCRKAQMVRWLRSSAAESNC